MAITLKGRPQEFTPVYNPMNFFFDSTNKEEQGFRYVIEGCLQDITYGPNVLVNSYTNNGGLLQINCNSSHGLIVGDKLELFQASLIYLGVHDVVQVVNATSIQVNTPYAGSALLGAEYIQKLTIEEEQLFEIRVAPRPEDGYGEAFISKLLAPLITRKFDPSNTSSQNAPENFLEYTLKVGEEYLFEWNYSDYEFHSDPSSQYNGYVKLRQFVTTVQNEHAFNVGDQINVTQNDGGALKPALTGLHTIVEIVDDWTIVIDMTFNVIGSGATVGGSITYADNRSIIFRGLLTLTGVCYNGAFNFLDFRGYNQDEYKLSVQSTTNKLLTTVPDGFRISEKADAWINYNADNVAFTRYVYFENSNGDIFRRNLGTDETFVRQFYAGAIQPTLSVVSGSLPLVKDNTEFYEFWTTDSAGNPTSKRYRFAIDRRCRIEEHSVLFEDRLGSFIPLMFQLHTEVTTTVERLEYKQKLGDLNEVDEEWQYNSYDEGYTTADVQETEQHLIRSNWMNRTEIEYFKELIGSPTTYININGVYISCKLKTLSTTTIGEGKRKLVRKELMIMMSNQNAVNI